MNLQGKFKQLTSKKRKTKSSILMIQQLRKRTKLIFISSKYYKGHNGVEDEFRIKLFIGL